MPPVHPVIRDLECREKSELRKFGEPKNKHNLHITDEYYTNPSGPPNINCYTWMPVQRPVFTDWSSPQ